MSDSDRQLPPPPQGRFQFRLRTMFLVFFAVAVLLGFWTLRQRQRQKLADFESRRFEAHSPISLHVVYLENPADQHWLPSRGNSHVHFQEQSSIQSRR